MCFLQKKPALILLIAVFCFVGFGSVLAQDMGDFHCCDPCISQEHIGKDVADGNCQARCNQDAIPGLCGTAIKYHCCTNPCQDISAADQNSADQQCQMLRCGATAAESGSCQQPTAKPTSTGGGQSAEQLQATAAAAFNKFGVAGNVAGAATLIGRAVKLLMAFMGSIALVLYVYAGIVWMTASGDKQKVGRAKEILVWTTFGVVVMLGSYVLANFIFSNVIK